MSDEELPLANSMAHFKACHERWMERLHHRFDDPNFKEEWSDQQCMDCKFFTPLTGVFVDDWGVCSNPASEFDGIVRFEHDGCDAYELDPTYYR
jgi:hypothetical protein